MAPTVVFWTGMIRSDRIVIPLAGAAGKPIRIVRAGVETPGGVTRSALPTGQVASDFTQVVQARPAKALRSGRTVTGTGPWRLCTWVAGTATGSSAAFVRATVGHPVSEQLCLDVFVNASRADGAAPAAGCRMTRTVSWPAAHPGAWGRGGWVAGSGGWDAGRGRPGPIAVPPLVAAAAVLGPATTDGDALAGGVFGAKGWPAGAAEDSWSLLPHAASASAIMIAPAARAIVFRVRRRMRLPPFRARACRW
jgi:hypothetical protein